MTETTDYVKHMWSTLRYFANSESDDLEIEVMAWAYSEIEGLRAALRKLLEASPEIDDRLVAILPIEKREPYARARGHAREIVG